MPNALMPRRYAGLLLWSAGLLGLTVASASAQSPVTPDDPTERSTAATPPSEAAAPESWAIHGQLTGIAQYHPAFRSGSRGDQSLDPGSRGNENVVGTVLLGVRLWRGAEVWVNPEIDQGYGLSNTFGVAGFPGPLSYKAVPTGRIQRLFLRQTIDLGGEKQTLDPDQNVLGGDTTANRVVVTIGKFSVIDIFDTNKYAHDPNNDFLNWAVIDMGAYDYAADGWGYTYGASAEWYQDWWTVRAGAFQMSQSPNSQYIDTRIGSQFHAVAEAEERHTIWGQDGKLKLLVFNDRARLASLGDAIQYGVDTNGPANPVPVRRLRNKAGAGLNLEQAITSDIGVFARASFANGGVENADYTDIDRSVSVGLSMNGTRWGRADDTVGIAGALNAISKEKVAYFRAGGLGGVVGDGTLLHYGAEKIVEAFYSFKVVKGVNLTADYQFVANPGYNRDRGPVSILGARLHAQY